MRILVVLLLLCLPDELSSLLWGDADKEAPLTFGIVGAGLSGAVSAKYLRDAFPNATIVVFEKDAIGGRVRSDEFQGTTLETGATSWSRHHRLLNEITTALEIPVHTPLAEPPLSEGPFAVWDGRDVVFKQKSSTFMMVMSMVYRYGLSPLYSQRVVADIEARFADIYALLEDPEGHPPWERHETMLRHLQLYDLSQKTLKAHLREGGFTAAFVDEIVEGVIRNNYGQSVGSVNALAGMLALSSGAVNVMTTKEGNVNIIKALLKESGAIVMNKSSVVALHPNNIRRHGAASKPLTIKYDRNYAESVLDVDAVIIGAPISLADIEMTNERNVRIRPEPKRHTIMHVVLVLASALSPHYFKLLNIETDPTLILTMEEDLAAFSSLGVAHSLGPGQLIYKVRSRETLSEELLDDIFINRTDLLRHTWHSYPPLKPVATYPPVRVMSRVYHPSGIEAVTPLLEAAVISARNAVNLLLKDKQSWRARTAEEQKEFDRLFAERDDKTNTTDTTKNATSSDGGEEAESGGGWFSGWFKGDTETEDVIIEEETDTVKPDKPETNIVTPDQSNKHTQKESEGEGGGEGGGGPAVKEGEGGEEEEGGGGGGGDGSAFIADLWGWAESVVTSVTGDVNATEEEGVAQNESVEEAEEEEEDEGPGIESFWSQWL